MTSPSPAPAADPDLVAWARDLAVECSRASLEWFRADDLAVDTKSDGSPVTVADRNVERSLRERLAIDRPGEAIVGEEEGGELAPSGRTWIIDPIDGTRAFTRGVPSYSTLLASIDEHGVELGVIVLPALDEVVWAGRGRGTRWRTGDGPPRTGRVSATTSLEGAVLATSGTWYWPDHLAPATRTAGVEVTTWGDAYGYALVATGRVDAMVDTVANLWDLAAPALVVSEAGGRFSALDGSEDPGAGSGLGSNGVLHQPLLELLGH